MPSLIRPAQIPEADEERANVEFTACYEMASEKTRRSPMHIEEYMSNFSELDGHIQIGGLYKKFLSACELKRLAQAGIKGG